MVVVLGAGGSISERVLQGAVLDPQTFNRLIGCQAGFARGTSAAGGKEATTAG
jgi:hypothetical protein